MSVVPKKSAPWKFAYIRHFQRIGLNATKFEKTLIHFKSDVFVAVAVVDAKTPIGSERRPPMITYAREQLLHLRSANTALVCTMNLDLRDCDI